MNLNGLYTEANVSKRATFGMKLAKAAIIAVTAVLFIAGLLFAKGILMFLGVAAAIACYFVVPMFNITYEYIFCDGQIDFDKITNGEKRKTLLRIDMDNVEVMAPENSYHLDSYRNQQGLVIKDFSSNDPSRPKYCIFTSGQDGKYMVTFEPSATMVDYAWQKGPRKVFRE